MCDIFGGDVPVDSETLLVIKDLHLYCVSKTIKANFQEQISLQNSFTI
jgi:hypothetical protein